MTEKIPTYGDLIYELELVKGIFRDMKNASLEEKYEVLEYLANLQDLRIKEDKRITMFYRLGLLYCKECGNGDISIIEEYDITKLQYKYNAHCHECGHNWQTKLDTWEIRTADRAMKDIPLQKVNG